MNAKAFTRIAAAIVVALTAGGCADEGFDPAPAPGTATAAPPPPPPPAPWSAATPPNSPQGTR